MSTRKTTDALSVFFCMSYQIQDKSKQVNVSTHVGDGIVFFENGKQHHMKTHELVEMKSHVVTHEGENLSGKKARDYMDKYSAKYLGKNLAGSYRNTEIKGYV